MRHFLINNLSGGGAERQFIHLARMLKPDTVTLITDKIDYDVSGLQNVTVLDAGNRYRQALKVFPFLARYFLCDAFFRKPVSLPSVVVSFMDRENLVNIAVNAKKGHRVIVSVRNTPSYQYRQSPWMRWLIKRLYPKADAIVPNSYGIRQDLIDHFGVESDKIKVIENGFSISQITEQSRAEVPGQLARRIRNKRVILNMGRMVDKKGQCHLVRIGKRLKAAISDCHIVLMGSGPEAPQLKALISDLGLSDDITLIPFQQNPYPVMRMASCFVLPSYYEGFPNVLVEAMALGVPVLATDCQSGPREILEDSRDYHIPITLPKASPYGILLPPLHRPESDDLMPAETVMADELIGLLTSPEKISHYQTQSRRRAAEFSMERMQQKWTDVIDAVERGPR